jgi:hypothetical protein
MWAFKSPTSMGKKITTSKKPRLLAPAAPEESGSSSTPQQPHGEGEDAAAVDLDQTGGLPDDLLTIITLLPSPHRQWLPHSDPLHTVAPAVALRAAKLRGPDPHGRTAAPRRRDPPLPLGPHPSLLPPVASQLVDGVFWCT